MSIFKSTEWEVVSYKHITEDENFETIVIRPCKFLIKKKKGISDTRTIRLPYRPRVGQLIDCPKLT